jgi:hypothetical protein
MFHIGFLSKYWLMMMMIIMILSDCHFGVLKIASKIKYKLQLTSDEIKCFGWDKILFRPVIFFEILGFLSELLFFKIKLQEI